jgi:hypothetical protein
VSGVSAVQTDTRRALAGLTPPRRQRPRTEVWVVAAIVLVAVVLAGLAHAHHLQGLGGILRGSLAGLVLFGVCGDALAHRLVPSPWRAVRPLFALGLGAAASALVLTAFGVAHVPLRVSLWLTLALGLAASVVVRRRTRGERDQPGGRRPLLGAWVVVLLVLFCVALIPVWRLGGDTIYGQNPDAHQVAGIAVLFQHVPPTGTDNALPIDTVPQEWRFRYPIFYPLAAASNLSHFDPIRVFPAMAALLLVIAAFGFAMLAVGYLGVPAAGGPVIAAAVGLSWTTVHLAWHPYWNQLWGLAMFPYALLFGWRALEARDPRAAVLFAVMLVMLWLAYPLALPYPLVIVGGLAIAYWRTPKRPDLVTARAWIAAGVGLLLLAPAVVGAALKLREALSQLLSPGSALWGGDIHHFLPFGKFVGTGGGILPALAVAVVAGLGLWVLPRRPRLALGIVLVALCLLDLRFRLTSSGSYMDFKHLTFVGTVIVTLAASAVLRLLWSGSRATVALGLGLGLVWTVAAVLQDRRDALVPQQVPAAMFQIRDWASRLPHGASVRIDIPPGGMQLWAVYMLGDHPVDSAVPVLHTTYARADNGLRASYALSWRYYPNADARVKVPYPAKLFAQDPPLFENAQFVLRKVDWPARYNSVPDTASTKLVEP